MELEDITQNLGYCIARLTEKITLYEWTIKGLKGELEWYKEVCKKNNISLSPAPSPIPPDSDTEEEIVAIDLLLPSVNRN